MVALHKGWLTICILPGTVCKYDKDLKIESCFNPRPKQIAAAANAL